MRTFDLKYRARSSRPCRVHVGAGAARALVEFVGSRVDGGRVAVVSDSNVAPLYGEPLRRAWTGAGVAADLLVVPAGEASKTRETKAALEDRLAGLGFGRDGWIVAVGGGVVGDLSGFLAATWHRGVRWVQAPTSLLAMVDASIGGKTGVDLPAGKNLIGAFHQPEAVFADTDTLRTLPDEPFRLGFAEVVKTAAVGDAALFRKLERAVAALLSRERDALDDVVETCARRKGRLVVRDERDGGVRGALNFGHTVGHAIEQASGYRVAHGEAVALGMIVESRLATSTTGLPDAHARRILEVVERFGLPTRLPVALDPASVRAALARDKKVAGGAVRCALPASLGRMPDPVLTEVDPDRVLEAFHEGLATGAVD